MDLGSLISRTTNIIKRNWILVVPPILTQAVVPLVLFAVAALTFFPLGAAFSLTGDLWGFVQTVTIGALALGIVGFLVDTFVTAGWAYMNKRSITDGDTGFDDLWIGARKYFVRILGGRILVGIIVFVPIAALVAAVVVSIATSGTGSLIPPEEATPEAISGFLPTRLIGMLGIIAVVGLAELVLYIFLLPWMQALVTDDLTVWASIKASASFVRSNFATMIGYLVISVVAWAAASWVTSFFSPGLSFSDLSRSWIYADGMRLLWPLLGAGAILNSVVSAVLSAFFTLLLFVIYADRTHGVPPVKGGPSTTPAPTSTAPEKVAPKSTIAPRGMQYCINCGARIISLAVFCPNCGARQPPLPSE